MGDTIKLREIPPEERTLGKLIKGKRSPTDETVSFWYQDKRVIMPPASPWFNGAPPESEWTEAERAIAAEYQKERAIYDSD